MELEKDKEEHIAFTHRIGLMNDNTGRPKKAQVQNIISKKIDQYCQYMFTLTDVSLYRNL